MEISVRGVPRTNIEITKDNLNAVPEELKDIYLKNFLKEKLETRLSYSDKGIIQSIVSTIDNIEDIKLFEPILLQPNSSNIYIKILVDIIYYSLIKDGYFSLAKENIYKALTIYN